ncbi:amino acid permease, partial [Klebsiella pneumoniae]|nr:amino acid permease [Klebsiella pneumoniae]
LAVFVVAIRLRHDIHASLPILIVGTLVMLLVIVGFIYSLWSQGSRALIWIIGSLLLSLIVAMVMKRNKTV